MVFTHIGLESLLPLAYRSVAATSSMLINPADRFYQSNAILFLTFIDFSQD